MHTPLLILLALLFAGCAVDGHDAARVDRHEADLPEPACGGAFAVAPELLAEFRWAAKRWETAAGCEVHERPDGIPVTLTEALVDRGMTTTVRREDGTLRPTAVLVRRKQASWAETLSHELGHALGSLDEPTLGHSPDGLMRPVPLLGDLIAESNLEALCSVVHCAAFRAETALEGIDEAGKLTSF